MAVSDNPNVIGLANRFAEATIEKCGTDEPIVDVVLGEVHEHGIAEGFEEALHGFIDESEAQALISKYDTNAQSFSLTHAILADEMSGSALARAKSILLTGQEDYSNASGADYFVEGLSNSVDLSSTASKAVIAIGGAAAIGLGVAASATSAPLIAAGATFTLGAVVVASAVAGGVGMIKNTVETLLSETDSEAKQNLSELGSSTGIFAMSAPFAPKGASMMKAAATTSRVGTASGTAAATVDDVAKIAKKTVSPSDAVLTAPKPRPAPLLVNYSRPQFNRSGILVEGKLVPLESILQALKNNNNKISVQLNDPTKARYSHMYDSVSLQEVLTVAKRSGMNAIKTDKGEWIVSVSPNGRNPRIQNPIIFEVEGRYLSLSQLLLDLNQNKILIHSASSPNIGLQTGPFPSSEFIPIPTVLKGAKNLGINITQKDGTWIAFLDL
jgi:hypothetical protein